MNDMVKESIEHYGASQECLSAICQKLKQKEELVIVSIGGSITAGEQVKTAFPLLLGEMLCEHYGYQLDYQTKLWDEDSAKTVVDNTKPILHILNLGERSVDSAWGFLLLCKAEQRKPDLVTIDFSINDRKDTFHRTTMESMLRRILSWEWNAQPILFNFETKNGYSCYGHISYLCNEYELPILNCARAFTNAEQQGKYQWSDYSKDGIHPTQWGHEYIARCIFQIIDQEYEKKDTQHEKREYSINQERLRKAKIAFGDDFQNLQIICENIDLNKQHQSITMEVAANRFVLAYLQTSELPSARIQITIDNKKELVCDTYETGIWQRPYVIASQELDSQVHQVVIELDKLSAEVGAKIFMIASVSNECFSFYNSGGVLCQVP